MRLDKNSNDALFQHYFILLFWFSNEIKMITNTVKSSAKPIHVGINKKGSLFRHKREWKGLDFFSDQACALMIGVPEPEDENRKMRIRGHFRSLSVGSQRSSNSANQSLRTSSISATPPRRKNSSYIKEKSDDKLAEGPIK